MHLNVNTGSHHLELSLQLSKDRILKLNNEQTWKTSKDVLECNKDSARSNIIKPTKDWNFLGSKNLQKSTKIHKMTTCLIANYNIT